MKALITGVTGFAGSFLAEKLVSQKKYDVYGTYLTQESLANVEKIKDQLNLIRADLSNSELVTKIIKDTSPDIIFHLAALTSPADSFRNPIATLNNNISLQTNILESVRTYVPEAKILIISSADIYGKVTKENLPISENTPLMPTNPYSVSKIAQDYLGLMYNLTYGLKTIIVRPFNHIGPRQSPNFAVSSFAKQIAEIEKGKKEPAMLVGNLDAKRDFTDVRDMMDAYILAVEKGKYGDVYNLGSGKSYKMLDILNKLISLSKLKIAIKTDPKLLRPSDNPELICDSGKFRSITGWAPKIPLEKTLLDTLDYWRNII
jgi:GDP-4-dehydro-6-deoxy-D-mannose reductase